MIISFAEKSNNLNAEMDGSSEKLNADIKVEQMVSTNDYNKLENIPTLNGKPLKGDIWEEDPTIKAISLEELAEMWKGL